MATLPSLVSPDVAALRSDALLYGVTISLPQATRLLAKVKDSGICVDALLLKPRPAWLSEIVGALK